MKSYPDDLDAQNSVRKKSRALWELCPPPGKKPLGTWGRPGREGHGFVLGWLEISQNLSKPQVVGVVMGHDPNYPPF